MCRSQRELSNAYLLSKFGFDTAENEPSKLCPIERCSTVPRTGTKATGVLGRSPGHPPGRYRNGDNKFQANVVFAMTDGGINLL